jgi:hypothetical protein
MLPAVAQFLLLLMSSSLIRFNLAKTLMENRLSRARLYLTLRG